MKKRSIHEYLAKIPHQYDITFLGVFGSYARNEENSQSDIDLLVRFSEPKSLFEMVRIERELGKKMGKKVDLLTEKSLSPYLRDSIYSEMKFIYEK